MKRFRVVIAIALLFNIMCYSIQVEAVSISKEYVSMSIGNKKTLKVNGHSKKVKWSSTRVDVADVNEKGTVEAKGCGQTIIIGKAGGKEYRCYITVKQGEYVKYDDSRTYVVGTDIPVGIYCAYQVLDGAEYKVSRDESLMGIQESGTVKGNSVINIYAERSTLTLSGCYLVDIKNAIVNSSSYGGFMVGRHLDVGKYTVECIGKKGYFEVYNRASGTLIKNGVVSCKKTKELNLKYGQYVRLESCRLK